MRTVLNIIRMDFVMVRRRVRIPMLLLILLVLPFSFLIFPAATGIFVLFSGLTVYTVFGMDDRDHLSRLYEVLPMRRSHLIIGRFAAGMLAILLTNLLALLLGWLAYAAKLFTWSQDVYTNVIRAHGGGATVSRTVSIAFAVTCLLTGYLYMMNFIFGKHRELITVLVVIFLFLLMFVPVVSQVYLSIYEYYYNSLTDPFFQCKMYLSGIVWMAVCCGIAVLLRGRSEYK